MMSMTKCGGNYKPDPKNVKIMADALLRSSTRIIKKAKELRIKQGEKPNCNCPVHRLCAECYPFDYD